MEVRVGKRSTGDPVFSNCVEMNLAAHWILSNVSLLTSLQDKAWASSGITNKDDYSISSHLNRQGRTFDTKICKWTWEEVTDRNLKARVGKIVKVTAGLLNSKYVMVVRDFEEGVGVISESTDWPACIPSKFNALFVLNGAITEITEEEVIAVGVKFPSSKQFK